MSILVDENTRLVVQGITGKEGTFHTRQCVGERCPPAASRCATVPGTCSTALLQGFPWRSIPASASHEAGAARDWLHKPTCVIRATYTRSPRGAPCEQTRSNIHPWQEMHGNPSCLQKCASGQFSTRSRGSLGESTSSHRKSSA